MKKLLNLENALVLHKDEQKNIIGAGRAYCCEWCSDGTCNGWSSSPNVPCAFAEAC